MTDKEKEEEEEALEEIIGGGDDGEQEDGQDRVMNTILEHINCSSWINSPMSHRACHDRRPRSPALSDI